MGKVDTMSPRFFENYLGIDVAKRSHRCLALNSQGEVKAKPFSFDSSEDGFQRLLNKLEELNLTCNNLLIGLEATGNLWENLYSFLEEKGFKMILLNPYQTNKFREVLRKKAKTDQIDALVIAGLLRSGEYQSSYVPDELIQSLRELVRLRVSLMKNLKNYKRQGFSLLNLVFPEYLKLVKNPFGVVSCAFLKNYPTAKDFAQAKPHHLLKIARLHQGNHYDLKLVTEIISQAKKSIYSGKAQKARGLSLSIIISHIQTLQEDITELDRQIQALLKPKDEESLGSELLSIPGVGPKTIAALLAEIGDFNRFNSARQLIGYLGLFPKLEESGSSQNPHPKISKQGSPIARHALYMASVACLKHNPWLRSIYHKKISQGKSVKQALIVVARKLACMIYSLSKNKTTFNPERVFICA
jgi:transposase